jgi:hypothetical protein
MSNSSAKALAAGVKFSLCRVSARLFIIASFRISQCAYLLEVWQEIIPTPSWISNFPPSIIIRRRTPVKKHPIHDRSSTNHCCSWNSKFAIIQSTLRNAREIEEVWRGCKIEKPRNEHGRFLSVKRTIFYHKHGSYSSASVGLPFRSASKSDRLSGFSVSRSATVSPLVPPPITTKS